MLKWAKYRVTHKIYSNKVDAKIEFRCCMDRLTRDLKLYRISPQDLIKVCTPLGSTYRYGWYMNNLWIYESVLEMSLLHSSLYIYKQGIRSLPIR